MKLQSTTTLLNPISKNTLTNLLNEVRETIALEFGKKQVAALSSAELWNIQRRQRTLSSRRRFI